MGSRFVLSTVCPGRSIDCLPNSISKPTNHSEVNKVAVTAAMIETIAQASLESPDPIKKIRKVPMKSTAEKNKILPKLPRTW